jgi:DNA-binding CsgD family transcriptional regulator
MGDLYLALKGVVVISAIMQRSVGFPAEDLSANLIHAAFMQSSLGVALLDHELVVRFANPALAQLIDNASATRGPTLLSLLGVDAVAAFGAMTAHGRWQGIAVRAKGSDRDANRELHLVAEAFQYRDCVPGWLVTVREHVAPAAAPVLTDHQLIALSGRLTPRECEVMLALYEGASNKEIALRLAISPRTVEFHRARILKRFGAKSIVDLVRKVTDEAQATM